MKNKYPKNCSTLSLILFPSTSFSVRFYRMMSFGFFSPLKSQFVQSTRVYQVVYFILPNLRTFHAPNRSTHTYAHTFTLGDRDPSPRMKCSYALLEVPINTVQFDH